MRDCEVPARNSKTGWGSTGVHHAIGIARSTSTATLVPCSAKGRVAKAASPKTTTCQAPDYNVRLVPHIPNLVPPLTKLPLYLGPTVDYQTFEPLALVAARGAVQRERSAHAVRRNRRKSR